MIYCREKEYYGADEKGRDVVDAWLIADSTPDPFPTDGSTVDNMHDNETFAVGSYIQIVGSGDDNGKVYFFNGTSWYAS